MQIFPRRFDFSSEQWRGERSKQFSNKRDDAFQQLVGDALREAIPAAVQVMQTEGNDGSIDAFISEGAILPPLLSRLRSPAIVECKDNDDHKDAVIENVIAGWRKVANRLAQAAARGWPDLYQPWVHARSYIFITSALLPHKEARDRLTNEIEQFFGRLRAAGQSNVESVMVLDWSELRSLFDRLPRLADAWLGVQLPWLITHEQRKQRLTGASRYLNELPFVEPDTSSPIHPARLFDAVLACANDCGVLVTGPGGIGKTRTMLEVAAIAAAHGWRVLHVVSQAKLTSEHLVDTILGTPGNTLLIIDYLDNVSGLDFDVLRDQLLPEVQARGARLAFLAAARTVPARSTARYKFFDRVEMRRTTIQRDAILDTMLDHVASHAAALLGRQRTKAIAGDRPIIALFVMLELERLAKSPTGLDVRGHPPVGHELADWLGRRLDQDDLRVQPSPSAWRRDQVETPLVAATTVISVSPQKREHLHDIATRLLSSAGAEPSRARLDASHIMMVLEDLGWLEERGGFLHSAHDAVTDELLKRAIFEKRTGELREDVLSSMWDASLTYPGGFARLARSLERVPTSITMRNAISTFVATWFAQHAEKFAESLIAADLEASELAVFMMSQSDLLERVLAKCFAGAIAPWLELHKTHDGVMPVVVGFLASPLPAGERTKLCTIALDWCRRRREDEGAANVLRILLMSDDLMRSQSKEVVSLASEWVRERPKSAGTYLLMGVLLARPELDARVAEELMDAALSVLSAYLSKDPGGEEGVRALLADEVWGPARGDLELFLLLKPLVARRPLPDAVAKKTVESAITWLAGHLHLDFSAQIIAPLLRRPDLGGTTSRAIQLARAWLSQHGDSRYAGDVISVIIGEAELRSSFGSAICQTAMVWLVRYQQFPVATHLLGTVLANPDLPESLRDTARRIAEAWLGGHLITQEGAAPVLRALLERDDLPAHHAELVTKAADAWLVSNGMTPTACFVLSPLLARHHSDAGAKSRYLGVARTWLSRNASVEAAPLLFKPLLTEMHPDANVRTLVQQLVLHWVDAHEGQEEVGVAVFHLLEQLRINNDFDRDAEASVRVVNATIEWLRNHPCSELTGGVLVGFLLGGCFRPRWLQFIAEPTLVWLLERDRRSFEYDETKSIAKDILKRCIHALTETDRSACELAFKGVLESRADRKATLSLLEDLGIQLPGLS